MTYKLRRPPLLVYENARGIYSHCFKDPHPTSSSRSSMECGLSTANSFAPPPPPSNSTSSAAAGLNSKMAVRNDRQGPARVHKDLHVNFETGKVEIQERKTKFLTAKYGTHQMNLIKKRLGVEMWMYDELQYLFDSTDDCEVELDLDELLDINSDAGKRNWLQEKLANAKRSPEEVRKFIEELLKRAKTL